PRRAGRQPRAALHALGGRVAVRADLPPARDPLPDGAGRSAVARHAAGGDELAERAAVDPRRRCARVSRHRRTVARSPMAHSSSPGTYVGQSMKRREDRRLLLGAGRYVDDLRPAGALSVIFVRSPHGHARITRLDVEAVRKAPGVVAVVTGDQVRHLGPMPVNRAIPDMKVPPHPIIADGVVHTVGEPVVAIAAESASIAWDAAEHLVVEYDELSAAAEPQAALAKDAAVLFGEVAGNRSFRRALNA